MIHQVLVIGREGLCLVDRTYDENAIDPFLVSGFLAAVVPRMEEFGFTLDSLISEIQTDDNTYLSVLVNEDLIYAGIASKSISREDLNALLNTIAVEVSSLLNGIKDKQSMSQTEYSSLQDTIDLVISQEGIPSIVRGKEMGILPILKKVYDGKMKPEKAAKEILKSIEKMKKSKNKKNLENIKYTLRLLDQMFPPSKGSKMDPVQVVVQATYKGVSKMTIRMDKALSF